MEENDRKVVIEFCHLLEKSKQLFNGLRDLPPYGHKQWQAYFGKAFDVYTKLWKFQQQYREILDNRYGLKRWQIGEMASKIGQLYYHFYLRTSETGYLCEADSFYDAIRGRSYYTKASRENYCDLMVKKLRYYARYIVVSLLLNNMLLAKDLACELNRYIYEYAMIYRPIDHKEWIQVVEEVKAFVKSEAVVNVIASHSDPTPVLLTHRLTPLTITPVEQNALMHYYLQEIIIIGSCRGQVKFSELTMDMFRILQTLERQADDEYLRKDKDKKKNSPPNGVRHMRGRRASLDYGRDFYPIGPPRGLLRPHANDEYNNKDDAPETESHPHYRSPYRRLGIEDYDIDDDYDNYRPAYGAQSSSLPTRSTFRRQTNEGQYTDDLEDTEAYPSTSGVQHRSRSLRRKTSDDYYRSDTADNDYPPMAPMYNKRLPPRNYYRRHASEDHYRYEQAEENDGYRYAPGPSTTRGEYRNQTEDDYEDEEGERSKSYPNTPKKRPKRGYLEEVDDKLNPHKFLLFKPSLNQILIYLASGCKDLTSSGALLLYVSGDGCFTSIKNPTNMSYDVGGVATYAKVGGVSKNMKRPSYIKEENCLYPGDIHPFTRKPMFLIVESNNSFAFDQISAHFGQPLTILMSPIELPQPFQDQQCYGSLFTLFLHSPLTAFCYCCNINEIPVSHWEQCQKLIAKFLAESSQLVSRSRIGEPKNVSYIHFMGDDFLRLIILRYVFCAVTMISHRAFNLKNHQPRSVPKLADEILYNTTLLHIIFDLASDLGVRSQFVEPVPPPPEKIEPKVTIK